MGGMPGMGGDNIVIVATAKDNASATLKRLQTNVTALGSKGRGPLGGLLSGMGGISPVALGAAAGIGVLTGMLADGIAGALAEDKQMARLGATMKANIPNWNGSTTAVENFNSAAMDLAFSDDAARESMITLIRATRNVDTAMKDSRLAMDIARGAGIDLAAASELVAKASIGNTRALKAYGIEVQKGATPTEILTELQQRFAGDAEAYANTTAGKFEVAQAKVNNAMEDAGHFFINTAGGLMSYDQAMKGNTQSMADWLNAAGTLFPLLGGVADAFAYAAEQANVLKNHIASEHADNFVGAVLTGVADGMTQTQMYDAERAARGIANSLVPGFKAAGEDAAGAFTSKLSSSLVDDIRGNKSFVKQIWKDINWAINHPGALAKQLGKIQVALDSSQLHNLLTATNPMQRVIGQQIQARLTGQYETLTGTDYTSGVNSIVAAINSLKSYLTPGTSQAPYTDTGHSPQKIPGYAKGGYLGAGRLGLVGENGPEYIRAGRQGTTITPNSGGHGHNIILNGRVVGQAMDQYLGFQQSIAPTGIVSRG